MQLPAPLGLPAPQEVQQQRFLGGLLEAPLSGKISVQDSASCCLSAVHLPLPAPSDASILPALLGLGVQVVEGP